MAFTEKSRFVDWTQYDSFSLANTNSVMSNSYVISGFTVGTDNVLQGGKAFIGGLDIELSGTQTVTPVANNYLYLRSVITAGSQNALTGVTTQGSVATSILMSPNGALVDTDNTKYLIIAFYDTAWKDKRIGRVDTINGIGATVGTNNLVIDAGNINVTHESGTVTVEAAISDLNSEIDLKQNITDNGLNTVAKDIVPAINEVKADSEYHDLLQDDAIAIVNNKINALPMNGSLKNIRTSLVGIPTTFTNIDMFNTKQTVTNYQPLSLDYKGAAEPHIILMKTIGDYTFDFAIEATHTNGTDTTIILEAWVDGVLYDTATRTLVGGSNQINGITGFFTYSKGTDAVPSEIYFRFRASQGNTSANKALINTNLLGSSADFTFTDTDHVTGINLNESTYNGQTTSFIINDIKGDLNTLEDTVVKSVDGVTPDELGNVNAKHRTVSLVDLGILDADFTTLTGRDIFGHVHQEAVTDVGNDKPIIVRQRIDLNEGSFPILFGKLEDEAIAETGIPFNQSIMIFEYNINVSGDGSNDFNSNQHRFNITGDNSKANNFNGAVDGDDVYIWECNNENFINVLKVDIASGQNKTIYSNLQLRRDEVLNFTGWSDAAVYINMINGVALTGCNRGANRQNIDGTWAPFLSSTSLTEIYLAYGLDGSSHFEANMFSGRLDNAATTGYTQLLNAGSFLYQHSSFSSSSGIDYDTISSFTVVKSSAGVEEANVSLSLTTGRRVTFSLTPFTLSRLMQNNDNEIANTIYNNQFISSAQKAEFEFNGASPLFYTLGSGTTLNQPTISDNMELPQVETPNIVPEIETTPKGSLIQ